MFCASLLLGHASGWCQPPAPRVGAQAPPSSSGPGDAVDVPVVGSIAELFTTKDDGWFAKFGGLGEGNGVALGGGYRTTTSDGVLTTRALVSHRQAYLVGADWSRTLDRRGRWSLTLSASERFDAQQRFAGFGARPSTETGYSLTTRMAGVAATFRPSPWLSASAGVGAVKPTLGASTSASIEPLTRQYAPGALAGLASQPTFALLHAGVSIDTRAGGDGIGGGRYEVEWRQFDDRSDAGFGFHLLRAEVEQITTVGSPDRLVSIHAVAQQTTPRAGGVVPFYFQPTLGGGRSLRGYDRQRFRDQSAFFVQAEYQHRVHRYASTAVFLDAGQVAPSLARLRPEAFLTSYGVGVILGKAGGPAFRTDIAFGGDRAARLAFGFSTGF